MKCTVGLDVSMNSTGVVINVEGSKPIFIKFIAKKGGKHSKDCLVKIYNRTYDKDNYSIDNINKIISAEKQAIQITEFLSDFFTNTGITHADVRIEGGAMGGFKGSRINDMTIFSCLLKRRMILLKLVKTIRVIPPTSLKKYATGKGNAKKELIMEFFLKKFPNFDQSGKNDDVVDAYFLSEMPQDDNESWCRSDT